MATYPTLNLADGVTAVDCQKQVRSWQLLRSLIEFLIPTCNCTFSEHPQSKPHPFASRTSITGTIFGFRRGKLNFCIQTNSKSNPILLLELAVPTAILAREMSGGVLRIALESTAPTTDSRPLLSSPAWRMYLNGRKVGYALKRLPSTADMETLRRMDSVVEGAGTISGKELEREDELTYLRAKFDRVCGSGDSESFHLRDSDGSIGQELSIFFFRCR